MTEKKLAQNLTLTDSRRLTGPNLYGPNAGAVIDVEIKGYDIDAVIEQWRIELEPFLEALNWQHEIIFKRSYRNGASLGFTAPIDVLYAATEVNDEAWRRCEAHFKETKSVPFEEALQRLKAEIKAESNPALLKLQQAAKQHDVRFLSDDDEVSIGYGASCQIYGIKDIPAVDRINWSKIKSIPVALVTGTNGKSTSVRLASHVMKTAGLKCGITSTDYIRIDEEILDTGDYSGPGGARTLLRHPDTEVALLEVARGGMLRRGLGVNQAHCAAITNVAADHLGDYGINSVSDMVAAKFVVRQALNNQQDLILNADDSGVVAFAQDLRNQLVWFSWFADNSVITEHKAQGGKAVYVDAGIICYFDGAHETPVVAVKDIPITMQGAAKHNVHNTLLVVALAHSMSIDLEDIQRGLRTFDSSPENNPGRGNLFQVNDFQVLVDFAHNEHGLAAMANTIRSMPAKRRLVLMGQAGDRDDDLIKGLVKSALLAEPDCLVVCELEGYLRGRPQGEIPRLISNYALQMGLKENQIVYAESPSKGTEIALQWAQAGDVLLILALTDRDQVVELIRGHNQS